MGVFKSAFKIFFRSKLLSLLYAALTAVFIYTLVSKRSGNFFMYDNKILPFSMYSFAFFAFLGFEYFAKCRAYNLEDCLRASKNGYARMLFSQFGVISILVGIFMVIALVIYTAVFIKGAVYNPMYFPQLLLSIFLNYFLVPLTGSVFGLFFAMFLKRLTAYLLLVLITLLGSPLILGIDVVIYEITGADISVFFKIFDFFPPDLNWIPLYALGSSVLPHRWCVLLFWISFMLFIMILKFSDKRGIKKALRCVSPLVLSIIFLAVSVTPASKALRASDNMTESTMADSTYYENANMTYSESDFSITQYNAELSVFSKLNSKVKMTVDKPDLEKYDFTLYHGYNVASAEDQNGKALEYEQNGDYLTVYPSGETTEIALNYSGFSSTFYANAQGIFLPGYFPYLPQSGKKLCYNYYDISLSRLEYDEDSIFNIKFNAPRTVYSNMKETGQNTFSGKGSPTFLSGLYDDYTADSGIRVIYQYMNPQTPNDDSVKKILQQLVNNKDIDPNVKTIMLIPNNNITSAFLTYTDFGDHIVCSELSLFHSLKEAQLRNPDKEGVYYFYNTCADMSDSDLADYLDFAKDPNNLDGILSVDFCEMMEKYGKDRCFEMMKQYLNDENDLRNSYQFFEDALEA